MLSLQSHNDFNTSCSFHDSCLSFGLPSDHEDFNVSNLIDYTKFRATVPGENNNLPSRRNSRRRRSYTNIRRVPNRINTRISFKGVRRGSNFQQITSLESEADDDVYFMLRTRWQAKKAESDTTLKDDNKSTPDFLRNMSSMANKSPRRASLMLTHQTSQVRILQKPMMSDAYKKRKKNDNNEITVDFSHRKGTPRTIRRSILEATTGLVGICEDDFDEEMSSDQSNSSCSCSKVSCEKSALPYTMKKEYVPPISTDEVSHSACPETPKVNGTQKTFNPNSLFSIFQTPKKMPSPSNEGSNLYPFQTPKGNQHSHICDQDSLQTPCRDGMVHDNDDDSIVIGFETPRGSQTAWRDPTSLLSEQTVKRGNVSQSKLMDSLRSMADKSPLSIISSDSCGCREEITLPSLVTDVETANTRRIPVRALSAQYPLMTSDNIEHDEELNRRPLSRAISYDQRQAVKPKWSFRSPRKFLGLKSPSRNLSQGSFITTNPSTSILSMKDIPVTSTTLRRVQSEKYEETMNTEITRTALVRAKSYDPVRQMQIPTNENIDDLMKIVFPDQNLATEECAEGSERSKESDDSDWSSDYTDCSISETENQQSCNEDALAKHTEDENEQKKSVKDLQSESLQNMLSDLRRVGMCSVRRVQSEGVGSKITREIPCESESERKKFNKDAQTESLKNMLSDLRRAGMCSMRRVQSDGMSAKSTKSAREIRYEPANEQKECVDLKESNKELETEGRGNDIEIHLPDRDSKSSASEMSGPDLISVSSENVCKTDRSLTLIEEDSDSEMNENSIRSELSRSGEVKESIGAAGRRHGDLRRSYSEQAPLTARPEIKRFASGGARNEVHDNKMDPSVMAFMGIDNINLNNVTSTVSTKPTTKKREGLLKNFSFFGLIARKPCCEENDDRFDNESRLRELSESEMSSESKSSVSYPAPSDHEGGCNEKTKDRGLLRKACVPIRNNISRALRFFAAIFLLVPKKDVSDYPENLETEDEEAILEKAVLSAIMCDQLDSKEMNRDEPTSPNSQLVAI